MINAYTFAASTHNPGQLVVCHGVKGFDGGKVPARILSDSDMHRPARDGFVWVRCGGHFLSPETGRAISCEPFVIEWPKEKIE